MPGVGAIDPAMRRMGNDNVLVSVGRFRQRPGVSNGEEARRNRRRRTFRRRSTATPHTKFLLPGRGGLGGEGVSQGRGYQPLQLYGR